MKMLGVGGVARTSAVHRTVCPLNSVLLSFVTAEFISDAVSNSTKLRARVSNCNLARREKSKAYPLPPSLSRLTSEYTTSVPDWRAKSLRSWRGVSVMHPNRMKWMKTHLPAGIGWKTSDLHAVERAARTWSTFWTREILIAAGATSELHD